MTREEREAAIEYIKSYRKLDENLHNMAPKGTISFFATEKCIKYWDMAIKSLKQESVLDKIREEVTNLTDGKTPERIWNVDVLTIIDKYRAESEVEDADN